MCNVKEQQVYCKVANAEVGKKARTERKDLINSLISNLVTDDVLVNDIIAGETVQSKKVVFLEFTILIKSKRVQ